VKEHTYYYEQIVIGSDLNAVLYAYKTNSIFINNSVDRIFPFDEIGFSLDLGTTILGPEESQREVFNSLAYDLSMYGQAPFSGIAEGLRVKADDNELRVITKNGYASTCKYNNLRVFDSNMITGLPFDEGSEIIHYRVLDWFNVRSGAKHEHDYLYSDDNFCKKIHFYLSRRIDGNKSKKDLVSESIVSKRNINNVDYSDTIARLKTVSMMKEAGIKGTGNGVGKFLPIKLELSKREKLPIISNNYMECGNIVFDNRSAKTLIEKNVL